MLQLSTTEQAILNFIAANIPLLKADLAPMSFLAVNDRDYIAGLLGIYELNNIALLRDVYLEGYLASAEKYRVLRAEVDTPHKAALSYRHFVREAVRYCVLDLKTFRPHKVQQLAAKHNIPEAEIDEVVAYIGAQFNGLHEGNIIRYRLPPEALQGLGKVH